jgi:hypothetical protein
LPVRAAVGAIPDPSSPNNRPPRKSRTSGAISATWDSQSTRNSTLRDRLGARPGEEPATLRLFGPVSPLPSSTGCLPGSSGGIAPSTARGRFAQLAASCGRSPLCQQCSAIRGTRQTLPAALLTRAKTHLPYLSLSIHPSSGKGRAGQGGTETGPGPGSPGWKDGPTKTHKAVT